MNYDFDTIIDRAGSGSHKWAALLSDHPNRPEDVVPFSTADMEFVTAPEIVSGLINSVEREPFGYTGPNAAYYSAVTSFFKARHGWDVKKDEIMLFDGVVSAFMACVRAFTEPGDGVLVMTPVYGPFYHPKNIGRQIVGTSLVKDENGRYTIDFNDMEQKAKKARLFLLCSPHNPVGRVWTPDELRAMADICRRNNLIIISDEIHFDLVMPGFKHHVLTNAAPQVADNTIICTAPSKSFNLPGLMTANIVAANPSLRDKLRAENYGGANMLGLRACQFAYESAAPWLDACIGVIYDNYRLVSDFIRQHNPRCTVSQLEGTYLVWIDLTPLGLDKDELHRRLRAAMLYFNEGEWFGQGGQGHVRMNVACPQRAVRAALKRLLPIIRA